MSRSGETDWVAIGRAEKIERIVEVVAKVSEALDLNPYGDAEEIARRLRALTPRDWLNLQQFAGYKRPTPPSRETRDAVIGVFERRVDVAGEDLAAQ